MLKSRWRQPPGGRRSQPRCCDPLSAGRKRYERRMMATPLNVLIVEDRPADAALMVHELRRAGFDPVWRRVETEEDYLAHLQAGLDVILADYTLPQFDALRALQLLQERNGDIPFLILSATIGEE